MTDPKTPEAISDNDLDAAVGGATKPSKGVGASKQDRKNLITLPDAQERKLIGSGTSDSGI